MVVRFVDIGGIVDRHCLEVVVSVVVMVTLFNHCLEVVISVVVLVTLFTITV